MNKDQLDLLKKIEELTVTLDKFFNKKGKLVFARYPVAFALLVVVGATMMSMGIKELILKVPFLKESPWALFLGGILILILTGTLYKKLDR